MLRIMRNRSGRSVITGLTFFATGLYFFFAARIARGFGEQKGESVVVSGSETLASEKDEKRGQTEWEQVNTEPATSQFASREVVGL